jgi:hypothetical protein
MSKQDGYIYSSFVELYNDEFSGLSITIKEYYLLRKCYKRECKDRRVHNLSFKDAQYWSGHMRELIENTRKSKITNDDLLFFTETISKILKEY